MAKPKIRARYMTKALGMKDVTYTKCSIDPATKSLQQEEVTEKFECFMVYFPQGHSIRVVGRDRLVEMGYDKKPRMVDMNTGDIVDIGGDEYDFTDEDNIDVVLLDDGTKPAKSRTSTKEPA
jgi:hypothetical protein